MAFKYGQPPVWTADHPGRVTTRPRSPEPRGAEQRRRDPDSTIPHRRRQGALLRRVTLVPGLPPSASRMARQQLSARDTGGLHEPAVAFTPRNVGKALAPPEAASGDPALPHLGASGRGRPDDA